MIEQERLFSMQSVLRCYKPELAAVLVNCGRIALIEIAAPAK
jgi:hypothetical protein